MEQIDLARAVAAHDRDEDPGIAQIFYFPHPDELRLLEVCPSWPDSLGPSIWNAYNSTPEHGAYRSSTLLMGPSIWQAAQQGVWPLPQGWDLKSAIELLTEGTP